MLVLRFIWLGASLMSWHIDMPIFLCEGLRVVSCMAMPHYKTLLTGFLKCICCVQEHRYLKLVYENSLIKTFEALF